MKKFLSVLLALAVAFTFTFGSSMSAFAAEYTLDDYNTALTAEKTAQIGYMTSAKNQAASSYNYDENGFATISGVKYNKAAIEAAADAVINEISVAMDGVINTALNGTFPTGTPAPRGDVAAKTIVKVDGVDKDATTKDGMKAILETKTDALNKAQAPLTKAYVESKLTYTVSDYGTVDKKYAISTEGVVSTGTDLTAAQAMEAILTFANKKVTDADKLATDAAKISAYEATITYFDAQKANVKTIAKEQEEENATAITVEAAAKAFVADALNGTNKIYPVCDLSATYPKDYTSLTTDYAAFYEAKTATTKDTVFGVAVGNIAAVTKAEATAINNAAYNAIVATEAVLKNSGMSVGEISNAHADVPSVKATVAKTLSVSKKYDEVVALGEKLKGTYETGIKIYDDAKVDAAVKAAEALVNKDLGARTATAYLTEAAKGSLDNLKLVNTPIQKFNAAKIEAAKKFYSNAAFDEDGDITASTPATSTKYGDNKTPDADYVYLVETYQNSQEWTPIATAAIEDINAANSYAEIEAALAKAKEELAKVLTKANNDAVVAARTSYITALNNDANTAWNMLSVTEKAKYTDGDDANAIGDVFDKVVADGTAAITEAVTVDAVKAAYDEAKAALANVKTDDELKAMKEAVDAKVNALPYDSKLTVADKAAVLAAYDAYVELVNAGGTDATAQTIIENKLNAIYALEKQAILDAAKATNEKLEKVNTTSDADIAATLALRAEAEAILADKKALEEEVDEIIEAAYVDVTDVAVTSADIEAIGLIDFDAVAFINAENLLAKALKEGASEADKQAALDAYNALNEAQRLAIDSGAFADVIKTLTPKYDNQDAKADLLDMSRKLTIWRTSKTSIKVTAVGSVKNIKDNGYTVKYKFYKKAPGATSYKLIKTTTSNKYTYTNLKKGTNKFQVKVCVYDADGKLVATKMTYYRAAKVK